MKYLGVVAFVAFAATILVIAEGANFSWGFAGPRDVLLHREVVSLDWKLFRVVTRDVEFYPRFTNRTITAIKAIDLSHSQYGGNAILKKGGPGYRNATIHLKSQRSRGLNFAVEIIGY